MSSRAMAGAAALSILIGASLLTSRATADPKVTTDLTGYWRFDPAHSDVPPRAGGGNAMRGGAGWRSGGGDGGWRMGGGGGGRPRGGMRSGGDAGGARGAGSGDRAAGGAPMLPGLIHITQTSAVVSLEDSVGAVLEEITTIGSEKDTLAHAPGARVSPGSWQDSALVVDWGGSNGFKLTRTITLEQQVRCS